MPFTHDTTVSLQAAVALVNSAEPPETLDTIEDFDAFFTRFDYTGRHDRDLAELDAVREIRTRLRGLLLAPRDDAAALVNEVLAESDARLRLLRHDDADWHFHAVVLDAPLHVRILVETAMAMTDLIRSDETSRLSVCEDDDCEALVVDVSRNRSKRYCSTACGNRNAVAAYRARLRAAAPADR